MKIPSIPGVPKIIEAEAMVTDSDSARVTAKVRAYACAEILGRQLASSPDPTEEMARVTAAAIEELRQYLRSELLEWLSR
jgi:hypothetical protein